MSYKLADGSMSTDYKIGDEFTHEVQGLVVLYGDGGRNFATFTRLSDGFERVCYWERLKTTRRKNQLPLINQLHATIRQLKATIVELES
tara:strand:+ start:142 stop:408 length:267 start_codon:yes stop_codon:yes gene_type:complete